MASQLMLAVLAIVAILPAIATATQFIVGDDSGWSPGFNYTNWAAEKEFHVGDILVFKYTSGDHNVIKVGGPDFQACTIPAESQPLTSGNDMVTLKTAGKKWYICGKGDHCERGQKLVIDVLPVINIAPGPQTPSTPPPASSSSTNIIVTIYQILMVAFFLSMMIIRS